MNLVVEAASAKMGGILTYTRELSRHLPHHAGPLTLVAPAKARADDAPPLLRHVVTAEHHGVAAPLAAAERVREALGRSSNPVLFASASFTLQPRTVPQLLLLRNPIYFDPIHRAHVLPELSWRERSAITLRRGLALASADVARHVLTPTKAMRDLVINAYPALAGRVEALPYGVALERFRAAAARREPSPAGTLRVVCHSLLARHKPVRPIVEGVHRARAAGADVTLTLVDPPFARAHDTMPFIEDERRWARRGLDGGWLEITGPLPHDAVPALLARHDAFAFHTLCESFGHPYVEALASGLACVVSDIPVARELIGDAGTYVPLFDAEAFARAFVRLAQGRDGRLTNAREGIDRVIGLNLSWDRHFSRVARICRSLADDAPIPPPP
jgi:glycosyltransferase involved in cell wall biosynthesis